MALRIAAALGLGMLTALLLAPWQTAAAFTMRETPSLAAEVKAGKLPPVAERAPSEPEIVDMTAEGKTPGRQGGVLHILMSRSRDTRFMVVYGYARLVQFTSKFAIVPDILKSYDVEDGRVFTFHLRPGMRWSDGAPFTTEDFRYYWQDVANDKKLSPFGIPAELLVDGQPPRVDIIDPTTIRYSWAKPNPLFLPLLAGAEPLELFLPAHYMEQFHAKYADPKRLAAMVKKHGVRGWWALHTRMGHMYRNDNPDLPTLEPWINTTAAPAERFVFVRNPYYYRFDAAGHQLPYIDRVDMSIADPKLIPLKTEAGEADLQARYLGFDDYTFLKKGEAKNNYTVRLWHDGKGAELALYPNLNVNDPVWRPIVRDVRFRHALSLGIDRHEINKVVYFGLAIEGNNTVLPDSPLFKPDYQHAWAQYDPALANKLLDEMGLTKRDDSGIRLLPDGRPMQIVIETTEDSTEYTDVLQLIQDTWRDIGVKLFIKPSQLEVFRNRVYSGEVLMSIWQGLDNGVPVANMSPAELAPTEQDQLQWSKWGNYYESSGKAGESPDLPAAKELVALNDAWDASKTVEDRTAIWERMLAINAEQSFSIGIVAAVPQPVVVSNDLRNVPKAAIFNWDPTAEFGVYKPDTFWFDNAPGETALDGRQR